MLRNQLIQLLAILLFSTTSLFAARKPYVFINNTGRSVNDIHIVFTEENVYIEEPGTHSKMDRHINKFFPIDNSTDDNPNAIHRKGNTPLPNGGTVYGIFKKDGRGPVKIREWWWTYDGERVGDVQLGDQFKTRQSGSLIVPGEDVVRSIKLKNKVKDFKIDDRRWVPEDYGVNDLHIVLKGNVSPDPIDKKRDSLTDTPKYGGRFADAEKVTCNCQDLPPFSQPRARQRELNRLDEPCKSVCKNSDEKLQVIHYRNGNMPMDSTIEIKLRSSKDFELHNWWWTKDSKPITFDPDDKSDPIDLGAPNAAPGDDSKHKEEATPTDEREFDDFVVSFKPFQFEGGTRFIATTHPEGGADLPSTPDQILDPIYSNPELFEPLFKKMGGEFYAEAPVKDYSAAAKLNVNLRAFYPLNKRLLIGLGYRYHKTEITGSLPLSVFSTEPMPTQYAAKLSTQLHYSAPELILRYILLQSRIAFYGGVSGGMQFINSEDLKVQLAGEHYVLPYQFKHTSWAAGLEVGINYYWMDWFYTGLSGHLDLNQNARGKINKTPSIGIHLGVKSMFGH